MKTAEEKAMEYTDNEFAILPKSMAKEDMRHRAQKDFEAGYNEAMRWRDPKVELPEDMVNVFVKVCSLIDNEFEYYLDCVISDDTGYSWFKRHWDNVIGWRPIE